MQWCCACPGSTLPERQPLALPPSEPCLRVGGEAVREECGPELRGLRRSLGISDDFLEHDFDWGALEPSHGKGGGCMAFSRDRRWIVKFLSCADHETLSDVGFRQRYVERVLSDDSCLGRIPLVFFRHSDGQRYLVMNSWLPAVAAEDWAAIFDFKGCKDDKCVADDQGVVPAIRLGAARGPLRWASYVGDAGRLRYEAGKAAAARSQFVVDRATRDALLRALEGDVEFLSRHGLMDYSLIVGVLRQDTGAAARAERLQAGTLRALQSTSGVLYVGVIDFLQGWTAQKKLANALKTWSPFTSKPMSTVPPPDYGRQFTTSMREKFVSSEEVGRCPSAATP